MTPALEGLTVLSLEQATTLPFLTYRLACDGARVIRVEHRARPDPNRFVGRDLLGEPDMRAYFLPNNCGKEAITLNLGEADGRALLRELIVPASRMGRPRRSGCRWSTSAPPSTPTAR
jgi:formyl-CoA transferase